jgi:hypothetical protein
MNKFQKISAAITALVLVIAILVSSCKKTFDQPPYQTDPAIVANTSIKDLKARHTTSGAYDVITTDIIISGIVVADDKSGNLYKQIYIQDSTGAIQLNLDIASLYGTFPVGRKVFVKCNGLCLSDYHNTMQLGIKATINGSPSLEAIPAATISNYVIGGSLNNPVVPKLVTLSQLGTTMNNPLIGTLIELDDYEFQPSDTSKTYADTSAYKNSGDLYIRSCAPSTLLDVRSSGYANFGALKASQGHGNIYAIYTVYNTTKQLIIRDTSDVKFYQPYGCPLPPGTLLSQDFESVGANNSTLSLTDWKNISEVGNVSYQAAVFGTVKCAKVSAYNSGSATVTSWLITPAINLTGATAPKLNFTSAAGYTLGSASFKALISTNYAGSSTPSTATWTQLPATISPGQASGYSSFISSGNVSLSAYIGQTVYIAFRYDGSAPSSTTTFEIDDVKVLAQ